MTWTKDKSLERIQRRWDARDTEITVSKLVRDMDLENVTLRHGRLIQGAHIYATVSGSGQLPCLDTDDHARSAIQRTALWQAEVDRIAKAFDVPIIAFQGARAHLLTFRPIDDDEAIARRATLVARAIIFMTRDAFNPLFDEELRLAARAAADLGQSVATRAGTRGDSELLFLGNAANRPAKLLGRSKFVVTDRFMAAHGDQLEHTKMKADDEDAWILKHTVQAIEAAAAKDGVAWSIQTSAARLAADLEKWPLDRFKVSGATRLIKPAELTRANSKLVRAAVIIADIDGFSAYIDEAEDDKVKRDAILTLDAVRQEMREVLNVDYAGVRIQYQGDNMLGLVHLPAGDDEGIADSVGEVAAAMQASMDLTLPHIVRDVNRLRVAVGVALDDVVVACLGQYGKRNALVLGPAPSESERIQMRLTGSQTGIDATTHAALPAWADEVYKWDAAAKAYVADSLTIDKLIRVREALTSGGRRVLAHDSQRRVTVGAVGATADSERTVRSFRPYAY